MQGKITQVSIPSQGSAKVRVTVEVTYGDWLKSDMHARDEVVVTKIHKAP